MASNMSEYREKMKIIHQLLGGHCTVCSSETNLHVDHVDHLNKNFTIASHWGYSWEKLLPELKLCQLLCGDCHKLKTLEEGSLKKSWTTQKRIKHGTVWCYNKHGCRCALCKKAKSDAGKKFPSSRTVPFDPDQGDQS